MAKLFMSITILLTLFLAPLSLHIVRTADGFEFIAKNELSFRDTFVDVRSWELDDYFAHSSRIRDYLFYTKHYIPLKKDVEKRMAELSKKTKENLKPLEQSLHEWVAGKLR
ncbi:MAG: hypothetical protein WB930_14375 [Syntrophobacteraceae bacterium]